MITLDDQRLLRQNDGVGIVQDRVDPGPRLQVDVLLTRDLAQDLVDFPLGETSQAPVIDAWDAAAIPVNRIER